MRHWQSGLWAVTTDGRLIRRLPRLNANAANLQAEQRHCDVANECAHSSP
jgi:hypothetical protein